MNELIQMSPILLVMFALNVIGKGIKSTSWIPDRLIPLILPILGGMVYPFVGKYQPLPFLDKVPAGSDLTVLYVMVGIGCGGLAVWGNQLLRQWMGRGDEQPTNTTEIKPNT